MPRNQLAGYYGGGQTIGGGLASLGQNIGGAMMTRKERKRQEEAMRQLASLLYGDKDVPNISDPAKKMAGLLSVGKGLPMVGPMAAMQAAGMKEMVAPAGEAEEERVRTGNRENAMYRGLLTKGGEAGQALAIQEAQRRRTPPKPPAVTSVTGGFVISGPQGAQFHSTSTKQPIKLGKDEVLIDPEDNTILATGKSSDAKMMKAEWPPDSGVFRWLPESFVVQEGLAVGRQSQGVVVTTDKDGNTMLEFGGIAGVAGKKVQGQIEEDIYNDEKSLMRLNFIQESMKPEYLETPEKWANWLRAGADKFGVLSENQKGKLADFTTFRVYAYDNLNRYIEEITGAQMGETEAQRLMKAMPDPEKDSPTQFAAKVAAVTRSLQEHRRVYTGALAKGKSQAAAKKLADRASLDAYYTVGETSFPGPSPTLGMPKTPPGYEWQETETGLRLVKVE